jgi:hypothetical protein
VAGTRAVVRNSSDYDATRTRIAIHSRDAAIQFPAPGSPDDPTCAGGGAAILTVTSASSGESFSQVLPCEQWTLLGRADRPRGYRYRDRLRQAGACSSVLLRQGVLTVRCGGREAPLVFELHAGQTQAPLRAAVQLGAATFCSEFGGTIIRDEPRRFIAAGAPAPASCP